jgi:hypothetical protein
MYRKDICRYFLKGNCDKGDRCTYEHIKDNLLLTEVSHDTIEKFIETIPNKRVPNKNLDKYSKDGRAKMKRDNLERSSSNVSVIPKIINNIQKPESLNNSSETTFIKSHEPGFNKIKPDNRRENHNNFRQKREHQPNNQKRIKNTETFEPNHTPADMRVLVEVGSSCTSSIRLQTQDVLIVPGLFGNSDDLKIYNNLLKEMEECGIDNLWKLWHGDNHLIADDHRNYKERVPTFISVINKIRDYFKMDIKATRFNWYRNDKEWKPFHHDASYIDPEKAKIQNMTVGVSFGATRDIAFEDAIENKGHRRVISFPLTNGTTYAFTRDINSNWRHGVPQLPENKQGQEGRISIIAWGFVNQDEAKLENN